MKQYSRFQIALLAYVRNDVIMDEGISFTLGVDFLSVCVRVGEGQPPRRFQNSVHAVRYYYCRPYFKRIQLKYQYSKS